MTTTTDFNALEPLTPERPAVAKEQTPFRRFVSDFAESKVAVVALHYCS